MKYLTINKPQSKADLLAVKRKFAQHTGRLPLNSELLLVYRRLLKNNKIKPDKNLEKLLKKKNIRTLSGIAAISVLTKEYPCPGACLYCPTEKKMPKSYLANEPAVMRAVLCDFHPFKQVALRLKALENNGHATDKLELIVMGGTWTALPEKYRLWFIYSCFAAANKPAITIKHKSTENTKAQKHKITMQPAGQAETQKYESTENTESTKTLNHKDRGNPEIIVNIPLKNIDNVTWQDLYREQKKNETAKHRIIGLTLETRPDFITWQNALIMRQLGCTRVELGVQHLDDKILAFNRRGHGVEKTIKATKILRSLGFKITYHLMLNLPGSCRRQDLAMFKKLFGDPRFQPDQIKIYPCLVTKNSQLYHLWRQKHYQPYTTAQLTALLIKIKKLVPEYVRVIRVIRDIPEVSIVAGNKVTNLRQTVLARLQAAGTPCCCIRCREVGHQLTKTQKTQKAQKHKITPRLAGQAKALKLFIQKYPAGGGEEYFLSYESMDKKVLYAFCRLYLPNKQQTTNNSQPIASLPNLGRGIMEAPLVYSPPPDERGVDKGDLWLLSTPIIRELHTYGELVPIAEKNQSAAQHKGLGKKLINEAEKISWAAGFQELAVIAGIGVRPYYRKLGYSILKDTYLVKEFR